MKTQSIIHKGPELPVYHLAEGAKALSGPLTAQQRAQLAEDVHEINKALDHFANDTMVRIHRIRDDRLFRETHDTFEAFCKEKFDFGARRGRQLASGGEVILNLLGPPVAAAVTPERNPGSALEGPTPVMPTSERQVRPLVGLPKGEQREVWKELVEKSGGKAPTAKRVVEAVQERRAPAIAEVPEWPQPNGLGRYPEAEATKWSCICDGAVEILVLQIGKNSWISCGRYEFQAFNERRLTVWPELRDDLQYATSEAARAFAAKDIAKAMAVFLKEDRGLASALSNARQIATWANGHLKDVAYAQVKIPPPPELKHQPRETDSSSETPAADPGMKSISGLDPRHFKANPKTEPTAKEIYAVAREAVGLKDWSHTSDVVKTSMRAIAEWHLKELDKVLNAGKQAATAAMSVVADEAYSLGKSSKAGNPFVPAGERRKRAAQSQHDKDVKEWVICRVVKDSKPKYWSGPNAWTIDPSRAKKMSNSAAVMRLKGTSKFDSCKNDIMVKLDKALRRFQKGL